MPEYTFTWRGFMLDSSRHFMPPDAVRQLISAAALCGMNRMHWHLTDDQGWRVEIRKYPALTGVGSRRGRTFFGGVSETENNSGFYTCSEIREIVAFAKEKGIEIIPEIEIPGHAGALLAAMPELGCRRRVPAPGGKDPSEEAWPATVEVSGGIFPNLICAGRDEVLRVLEEILAEITELFPFPVVHIGGDEALKLRWRRCPDCRRRMRGLGISAEDGLQRWLVLRVGEFLASRGRRTVVWNDVLNGGPLPDHFIVQQWMDGEDRTHAFMESGGQVIRSDHDDFYLDYPYGAIDLHHLWETSRIPAYAEGLEDRLLGIECPLWTERVTNPSRAAFMLFPRLAGAGLLARKESLSWPDFRQEAASVQERIATLGLEGAPESCWHMTPEKAEADREADHRRIYAPEAKPYVDLEHTLVLLEKTERFMREIGIPEDFLIRAGDCVLAEAYGRPVPAPEDGADVLARRLMDAVESRAWGAWKDLPESVWLDTMKCFPRFISEHRRSYGFDGFDRGDWTVRQVEARLFRVGALEYELLEENGKRYISLHIPSDISLEPDPLNASVAEARSFLRSFFPDWANLPMVCGSWLLSPALSGLLPAGSRILRFQAAFDLTETDPESTDAVEWVFGVASGQREDLRPEKLPEDTSLRRRMKALLLSGGVPGSASGVLARPFA